MLLFSCCHLLSLTFLSKRLHTVQLWLCIRFFKVIFAPVEPLCTCVTLKLYRYIEKTKWKLCYVSVSFSSLRYFLKFHEWFKSKKHIEKALFSNWKKKMFCHTFKFTQDYTEEIRNKTQISWFLLFVFACSSRFCHFFYSFQSVSFQVSLKKKDIQLQVILFKVVFQSLVNHKSTITLIFLPGLHNWCEREDCHTAVL